MKTFIQHTMILIVMTCLSIMPGYAHQQDNNGRQLDKAQAAERAKQQVNGRILRIDKNKDNYRVKVLKKSGRVVSVDVDKRSGEVSPPKDKDRKR
ncbi:PepSY domain-containing protein [Alteromonas sp. ASW11-130]|uniref:PepSY domain-containing protein n=1 Tax=Alteromonas sp. ASW11-130 TaxID=3015775 RepID=UPI0022419848|nr:PepSY domain-containing protein [Alteromonas sp. ASW11-130]MCW8091399.1 PepSY domain-containing protein [Alteromonas sp. ASW11-130]